MIKIYKYQIEDIDELNYKQHRDSVYYVMFIYHKNLFTKEEFNEMCDSAVNKLHKHNRSIYANRIVKELCNTYGFFCINSEPIHTYKYVM